MAISLYPADWPLAIFKVLTGMSTTLRECLKDEIRPQDGQEIKKALTTISNSNFGDQLVSTCDSSARPWIMKCLKCSQLSKTI
jgi:hypothetical protein